MNPRFNIFLITLLLISTSSSTFCQSKNLVRNPSFETVGFPPSTSWKPCSEINPGDEIVNGWITPIYTSPDYYNSKKSICDGNPLALARTGEGRVGLIMGAEGTDDQGSDNNYREYITGCLTEPLKKGTEYEVSFHVALDRNCAFAVDGIGCYFMPDSVIDNKYCTLFTDPTIEYNKIYDVSLTKGFVDCVNGTSSLMLQYLAEPQIKCDQKIEQQEGWVEIKGRFVAEGGERFLTIGNFSHNKPFPSTPYTGFTLSANHIESTSYYYLDDVSVIKYEPPAEDTVKKIEIKDNFLFLLDVSNSMNRSGYLGLMKKEIKYFESGLAPDVQIGVMVFSKECQMIIPFTPVIDHADIDNRIDDLKGGGLTNGGNAIFTAAKFIDSLHLSSHCHIVLATDGVFPVNDDIKMYVQNILQRDSTNISMLQFGRKKNEALEEIAKVIPKSCYMKATEKNINKIFTKLKPVIKETTPQKPIIEKTQYTW